MKNKNTTATELTGSKKILKTINKVYEKMVIENILNTRPNRFWKKKRRLERVIAFSALTWIEEIEEINKNQSVLKISKFKKLEGGVKE